MGKAGHGKHLGVCPAHHKYSNGLKERKIPARVECVLRVPVFSLGFLAASGPLWSKCGIRVASPPAARVGSIWTLALFLGSVHGAHTAGSSRLTERMALRRLSCSLFPPFLNSAFEDETLRLRQLKLDNQVSGVSSFGKKGPARLSSVPVVLNADVLQGLGKKTLKEKSLTLLTKQCQGLVFGEPRPRAVARPTGFEDISSKAGLGFIVTERSWAPLIRIGRT